MVSRRFRFIAFFASVSLLLPTSSRACSVCQCGDPLFTPEGASSQPAGAFSVYLESLFSTKSSGVLPEGDEPPDPGDREKSFDRDLTLYASWTPVAKAHADGERAVPLDHGHGGARPTAARNRTTTAASATPRSTSRPSCGAISSAIRRPGSSCAEW